MLLSFLESQFYFDLRSIAGSTGQHGDPECLTGLPACSIVSRDFYREVAKRNCPRELRSTVDKRPV